MKKKREKSERSPWKYFANKKNVLRVYMVLRWLVLVTLVLELIRGDYENAFICVLTLVLFVMPSILERKLRMKIPDALEIVLLFFIFAADILGEIKEFYVLVPHWDTVLHTINGFLFAAVGFSLVNMLNEDKHVAMSLSPLCMAVVAFCFSMTIGVLWEFFEWSSDCIFGFDMQKDTVIQAIHSVKLHPEGLNSVIHISDIWDTVLVLEDGTQVVLGMGGYLDVGLMDTMKDLLVNLIGAVIFSFLGYFYVKTKGEGKIARMFIPQVQGQAEE